MRTKIASEQTRPEVERWRREQLVDSGFPLSLAARLAKDPRYDLQTLIELADRGCPPELAARVVAPLDQDVAA